jgi:dienelactone hydrolase
MKKIYVAIILISIIIVIMLVLAFFYLDQHRHQIFLYALYYDNDLTGYEKVDRYRLENTLIYKSHSEQPQGIFDEKTIRKIVFDSRGKNLINYTKEVSTNGADSIVYIARGPEKISFMATGHANFAYLDDVPHYGNDLIFEERAIATYAPLIRRYNFKKRGEQFVTTLTPISTFLPPMRQVISITLIGGDTIEIEGRKIDCEHLVLELKNGDLISVWITRRFKNILMVDIPKHGFKAAFCSAKTDIPVEEYKRRSELYRDMEVTFTNNDVALYGTLAVPTAGEAPYPAVILIWGSGPVDRDALGIFVDTAHALAEAGYSVLRFDKRGIGKSEGLYSTYTQSEEISDLLCAINFLKSLPEVDKSRIALLGHSEGGFYAAYLASADKDIRACIIMSALSSLSPLKNNCAKVRALIERMTPDDEEYLYSTVASIIQNRQIIEGKGDWITILDKRVFTKRVMLESTHDMLDTMKKIKVPVLILHGRKDDVNSAEEAKELGDALSEAGNDKFTIIYFGDLNHYFGTVIKDAPMKDHVEVDMEVLKNINVWLDKNLLAPPVELPEKGEDASSGPENHMP